MKKFGRALAAGIAAFGLNGCAAQAYIVRPIPEPQLVQVEIYDRTGGTMLPVYSKDHRRYIVGTPANEYAVRIRNRTGARVLVVTSVDGVNVISGDTASPSQSGYVLDPYGSVEIPGWRKNLERTAAFFFTDLQNSYAARTGRPENVGVIGVAVFREKQQPIALAPYPYPLPRRSEREQAPPAPFASRTAPERAEAPSEAQPAAPSPSVGARGLDAEDLRADSSAKALNRLGTGHGRNERSPVRVVTFERASDAPAETTAIQYDRRENLVAMGVLPREPRITRREPEPFPGMRFAPDRR